MDNTKERTPNSHTIERTVDRLRKRFEVLLPKCGGSNRLAKRLSQIDSYFEESGGHFDVANAKRGKAGEETMIRIINAMEVLAQSSHHETPSSRLNNSFKKMGIVEAYHPKFSTTQKLKEKFDQNKR